jgi:hypothetical protein
MLMTLALLERVETIKARTSDPDPASFRLSHVPPDSVASFSGCTHG